MPDDNIKVAVRVRPFNDREKQRKATLVIEMQGPNTYIRDPQNMKVEPKSFAFDHSYWSHDSFNERADGYLEPASTKYADQQRVFDDLGRGVLENAWKGYNCSLFAYGQTGSGKSYSMVGYGNNKGIVPIVCEELFKEIEAKKGSSGMEYQVTLSMLEIYCEKVRDLLNSKAPPKGGLKVREHPKKGFYVEGLISAPVANFKAIEAKIDEGTKNRTVAATNMNATSSRAHTIITINFIQKNLSENTTKSSLINLVDLAGSERHSETGSEGDRLKEGIVINQSLSSLGRVIKALADIQKGSKGTQVPYRDSVLTSLLKNALGGNSKTIMIAALSPADINYEETLSTLRFADRTKSIRTQAIVNESASDRLIRELREENQRLQKLLGSGGGAGGGDASSEELEQLRQQLEQNRKDMEQSEQSWQQRLAAESAKAKQIAEAKSQLDAKRKTTPHFWNLNEDPALTNMIVHFVKIGENTIGNSKAEPPADIQLNGLNILPQHAKLRNHENKKIFLTPMSGARVLVNGQELMAERELSHDDRVLFGGNHLFVFAHPISDKKKKKGKDKTQITYDVAQQEIAASSGLMNDLNASDAGKTKEDMILEEDLIKLLPQVYQANAMSDELRKNAHFDIVLVAPQARGGSGHTEIFVKLRDRLTENEFMWDKNKFSNRYYGMQEIYQNYVEGYQDWDVPKDRDPFYEPADTEILVGIVHVYLQSLAYMVEVDEQLPVNDFKGAERGQLKVCLFPCSDKGKDIVGEFVDSPSELVGKNLSFKVKILNAIGLPRKIASSRCSYKFYLEDRETSTSEIAGTNPAYGHEKLFPFKPVTKQLVQYLKEQALVIEVYGKQSDKVVTRRVQPQSQSTGAEGAYKAKAERLEAKLEKIQRLLDNALSTESKSLSLKAVQKILQEEDQMANGDPGKQDLINGVSGNHGWPDAQNQSSPKAAKAKKSSSQSKDRKKSIAPAEHERARKSSTATPSNPLSPVNVDSRSASQAKERPHRSSEQKQNGEQRSPRKTSKKKRHSSQSKQ